LEKDRAVPYVIDNITIQTNLDGNSDGEREHESSDTKDRSDCSSSEDMDL